MTSLAQGGSLHKYARQIYQTIGRVTLLTTKTEISAVKDFLSKQKIKPDKENINKLYDVVGRIIINNLSTNT